MLSFIFRISTSKKKQTVEPHKTITHRRIRNCWIDTTSPKRTPSSSIPPRNYSLIPDLYILGDHMDDIRRMCVTQLHTWPFNTSATERHTWQPVAFTVNEEKQNPATLHLSYVYHTAVSKYCKLLVSKQHVLRGATWTRKTKTNLAQARDLCSHPRCRSMSGSLAGPSTLLILLVYCQ